MGIGFHHLTTSFLPFLQSHTALHLCLAFSLTNQTSRLVTSIQSLCHRTLTEFITFFNTMMSPCSCQPVTRSSPLFTLRCCATLQVPEQDRVTDAQCSKEAPAVSLSPAAKGNCGRDSPCLSKKLLWGKICSHYKYRRLNCGTAWIWSIPTPCLFSSPPNRPSPASLLLLYHCTASGRPDQFC